MTRTLRSLSFAFAAAIAVPVASASAQDPFNVGTKLFNIGLVAGNGGLGIGAGVEVGVLELAENLTLGLGGTFAFQNESKRTYDYSTTWIVGNANVHLGLPSVPELDLYSGLSLGVENVNYDGDFPGNDESESDVVVGLNLGARYAFTPRLLGFAQLGIADAPEIFAGVSIKF